MFNILRTSKSKTDKAAKTLAEAHQIRIVTSDIIYELTRALEEIVKGGATAILGKLQILAVFSQKKLEKQVVGGKVIEGACPNRATFAVMRGTERVGKGRVTNLQQQKKEVHEVREGNEAGLLVSADIAIAMGDILIFSA